MKGCWPSGDVDAARHHFDWISAHSEARLSLRLRRLLSYLLERSILGTAAAPSQAEIARDVLGRDGDFDASVDAHARVEVARLRNALELFYGRLDTEPSLRFDLPKGSYCVCLKRVSERPMVMESRSESDCIIALTEPVAFIEEGGEFAQLILSDALNRCSLSPIVRCGALSVALLPTHDNQADALDAAKAHGASAVAICQVHAEDGSLRAFVSVFDTISRSVVCARSLTLSDATGGRCKQARQVGAALATTLSDPFEGIGPRIVARRSNSTRLSAILMAYDFINSQDLALAPAAFEALQHIVWNAEKTCPTAVALFGDLHRVCDNAGILPNASRETALELAARAYQLDRDNVTALLALGYAALSCGSTKLAASVASETIADETCSTLRSDGALLSSLIGDPLDAVTCRQATHQEGARFWEDLPALVPSIRRGDETAAMEILGVYSHGESMWHDLFRGVAAAYSNEQRLAHDSIARLERAIPETSSRVVPMLSGFFPDPSECAYIVDGLRKAGLATN